MKMIPALMASAALAASLGANAALTASTIPTSGSFLTLASTGAHTGTLGGTLGTIVGGAVLSGDFGYADIQAFGSPFGGTYLAAGPTVTAPALLTFNTPTSFVSFLWGSPDTYNTLTVTTSLGTTYDFVPGGGGLSFASTNGSQSYAQYVGFTSTGETITSLRFASTQDAFEAANFSVTAPVPEPETYALMLAGLGALAFVAKRRKNG